MVLAKMELFNVVLHEERSTISNFLNMEPGTAILPVFHIGEVLNSEVGCLSSEFRVIHNHG